MCVCVCVYVCVCADVYLCVYDCVCMTVCLRLCVIQNVFLALSFCLTFLDGTHTLHLHKDFKITYSRNVCILINITIQWRNSTYSARAY